MPSKLEKVVEGDPLIKMEKKVEETKSNTQFTQDGENPKAKSISLRNCQLILYHTICIIHV